MKSKEEVNRKHKQHFQVKGGEWKVNPEPTPDEEAAFAHNAAFNSRMKSKNREVDDAHSQLSQAQKEIMATIGRSSTALHRLNNLKLQRQREMAEGKFTQKEHWLTRATSKLKRRPTPQPQPRPRPDQTAPKSPKKVISDRKASSQPDAAPSMKEAKKAKKAKKKKAVKKKPPKKSGKGGWFGGKKKKGANETLPRGTSPLEAPRTD